MSFLGTKIHSAWAVVGSEGVVIIEALFDYAAQSLAQPGMEIHGSLDPSQALETFARFHPQIVVTDLVMPR
jgi:CheY-like chemotaxis protein